MVKAGSIFPAVDDSELDRVCRDLGARIYELRRSRRLTQQALADRLKIDVRDLQRLEAGQNVTVHTLTKIAGALGVDIAELFLRPAKGLKRRPGRPRRAD